MTHYHKLQDGRKTGNAIIDPDNVTNHYHFLDGEKTNISGMEDNHVHMVGTDSTDVTGPPIYEEDKKAMETKQFNGHITNHKTIERKNEAGELVKVGIVEGYIATWDLDRGDGWVRDQFVKGCFQESIADHLKRNRMIRFKDHHGRTVGGWLIDTVQEDERGLWGRAEINLDVQQGKEAMSLIRQGVLTDFSIGFGIAKDGYTIDGDIRTITKAIIWEGSIVDEPMNPYANVTGFKSVTPFQDLPLADRNREWDKTAAVQRIKDKTGSDEKPSADYKKAFVWYDRENSDVFSGYKLPIADVIDGKLTAVPRAIFAAAAAMQGARGGVDIPDSDRPGVIRHLERYYAKMDMDSPFKEDDKQLFSIDDVKEITPAELEQVLKRGVAFTKSAAKFIAAKFGTANEEIEEVEDEETKGVDKKPDNVINTTELKNLLDSIKSIKI